jgi:HD-GYP domain-containing protein (c-di-GMP phosphodiesterase class II)
MIEQRPPSRIVLAALEEAGTGQRWESDQLMRIGTNEELEVVLTDATVSPHHATLAYGMLGWSLTDEGSAAGTFLNGVPVTSAQKVELNDVIHCGKSGLRVVLVEEATVRIRNSSLPPEATVPQEGVRVEAVTHRSWEEGLQQLADGPPVVSHGKHLLTLLRAGHHLSRVESLQELLQSVLDDTVCVLNASHGSLLLSDKATGKLAPAVHSSFGTPNVHPDFSMSLAIRCMSRGESLLCADVGSLDGSSLGDARVHSVICALLRSPRKRLGVLQLFRTAQQPAFDEEELQLADAVAASASVGVECAQTIEQHRQPFLEKITNFVRRAVELRDPHTGGHSMRVQCYALLLAERLGAPHDEFERIRLGAGLHDLGKLVMADAILNKPGWLTREELDKIQQATLRGVSLASAFPELAPILPIIRSHHERWDGAGYPDGLAGEAIPYGARVVAIANCFDAMTVDQPYRQALPLEQAFAELLEGAGSQFDPDFVNAFLQLRPKLEALVTSSHRHAEDSAPAIWKDSSSEGSTACLVRAEAT